MTELSEFQQAVYDVIKEHPKINADLINFHVTGIVELEHFLRLRKTKNAISLLKRKGVIKSVNNKHKPHKYVIKNYKENEKNN